MAGHILLVEGDRAQQAEIAEVLMRNGHQVVAASHAQEALAAADALARQEEVRQRCLELLSNTDLEWLQERVLADLTALADAQSAALWISDERGLLVLRAWRGLVERALLPEKLLPEDPGIAPSPMDGRGWPGRRGRSCCASP